ncbi:MAG TPA: hypothetical protein VNU01_03385 [Egibacteraceae bacterium]|nr:hypothetical protein [Egibacteraceae bacterium]
MTIPSDAIERERARRRQRNEQILNGLNERLEERIEEMRDTDLTAGAPGDPIRYLCECSDLDCRGRVEMDPERFADVHRRPQDFVVLPGHEQPDIESVVARLPEQALVVRKYDLG